MDRKVPDGNANDEGAARTNASRGRRPQLAAGPGPFAGRERRRRPRARPAPAPTDEPAPAPAPGDDDAQQVAALEKLHESLKDKPNLIVCRKPLEDFGFRCGPLSRWGQMDAYPPQSLPSIKDIIGDKYTWTNSLNSVPKCIAYLEGVLNRLSGGRLFPSPSAPKKKRGCLQQAAIAADEAPAPKITERARPRWSSDEERRLRELVAELGETRWPAIAMRLGTGRTGAAVELRWATLKQKSPEAAGGGAAPTTTWPSATASPWAARPASSSHCQIRAAGGRYAATASERSAARAARATRGGDRGRAGACARKSRRPGPRRRRLGSGPARAGGAAAGAATAPRFARRQRRRRQGRPHRRARGGTRASAAGAGRAAGRALATVTGRLRARVAPRPARSRRRSLSEPKTPSSGCGGGVPPPLPPFPLKRQSSTGFLIYLIYV